MKLFPVLLDTVTIIGVNDENETLSILVVVSPEESDLVLTADVPHVESNVLVFDGLDIEADRGYSVHNFTQLHFVEDGGLTSCV